MVTRHRTVRVFVAASVVLLFAALVPVGIDANHQWGKYQWAGDGTPIALDVGDNVGSQWGSHLNGALSDWDNGNPDALQLTGVAGGAGDPSSCNPTLGRIEVCNASYGATGWLGVAQIWVSGGRTIVQATTKLNDTYFDNQAYGYDTPEWRRYVTCQEVGHDFGLDHQDTNFYNANLGTCMDYTDDPDGTLYGQASNVHPNQHDFDQLGSMYLAASGGGKPGNGGNGGGNGGGRHGGVPSEPPQIPDVAQVRLSNSPADWGTLVRANGRLAVFDLDLGGGRHVFTFVILA